MRVRVRDVMTADVVTIEPDTPLKEAAVLMARHRVSGLPVVDGTRVVGIVTEADFVTRLADEATGLLSLLLERDSVEAPGTVGDAMSPDPHSIGPDESVSSAARLMSDRDVNRLPVVGRDGSLVGIVSRADLMSVFARSDDEIASDVRDEGVGDLLGADPGSVDVSVSGGIVTLEGTVGTVTEKRMLEEFARRVAGVVGIRSELRAAMDETRLPPL